MSRTRTIHLVTAAATFVTLACSAPPAPPLEGVPAGEVVRLVASRFNKVDAGLALWRIQPGLGAVMMENGNRFGRLWYAGRAGNWDMAKHQHDEMLEILEVAETTQPARGAALTAFQATYLARIDKAIAARDPAAFAAAMAAAADGCNACHKVTSGDHWSSHQYVSVQLPRTDPAFYLEWKAAGSGSYVPNPPASSSGAAPAEGPAGTLDRAGAGQHIDSVFNVVDRSLALWNIQKGLGTVMIEYGDRFSRLYFAAKAGNWDMAKYQRDEMVEIQEVAETTRPARAAMLKAFEAASLDPLDKVIAGRDAAAFVTAYAEAVAGCNVCHHRSTGSTWKSYLFIKVRVPAADNSDYIVWKAKAGTGSYVAAPPAAAAAAPPNAPFAGAFDLAAVEQLVQSRFNTVDRRLALWNIQPGLGTVMIEYARRFAQMLYAINTANMDMARYQLEEMLEAQEVAETTRPARAPMLRSFESGSLVPLNAALAAGQRGKAVAEWKAAVAKCDTCHTASTGSNWSSYRFVQIQAPRTDPADYIRWNAGPGNTGSYTGAP